MLSNGLDLEIVKTSLFSDLLEFYRILSDSNNLEYEVSPVYLVSLMSRFGKKDISIPEELLMEVLGKLQALPGLDLVTKNFRVELRWILLRHKFDLKFPFNFLGLTKSRTILRCNDSRIGSG